MHHVLGCGGARVKPTGWFESNPVHMNTIIDALIAKAAEHRVEWLTYLPKGKTEYTAREITNAIGEALTAAGIPNNLKDA